MTTNVYIDGFNLYYGALKGTPYKWLDLYSMCQTLLRNRDINRIRYFTSRIVPLDHDKQAPGRQDTNLRALETIPNLSIHLGRFSSHVARYPRFPLVYQIPDRPPEMVRILRTGEKRSDVNLATLLLVDCVDEDFDEAVVISNDSDLMLPIQYATKRFGRTTGVINPQRRSKFSLELMQTASWSFKEINASVLAASQFPAVMTGVRGQIIKPSTW